MRKLTRVPTWVAIAATLMAAALASCSSSHSSSPQSISVTAEPTSPAPTVSDNVSPTASPVATSDPSPEAAPTSGTGTAPPDPAMAITQIKAAFTGAFGKPPGSGRYYGLGFVENGDQLRGAVDRVIANFPNAGMNITVTLGTITFTSPDSADVQFTPHYTGGAPYGTHTGEAVFAGGRWQVTQETYCGLLRFGAVTCP
jgi:biotin carboxyl carrier protein